MQDKGGTLQIQTGSLSSNIRMHRLSAQMSQEELAKTLGVNRMTICSWESGATEPNITSCFRLADLFGVSLDELVGRTPREVA